MQAVRFFFFFFFFVFHFLLFPSNEENRRRCSSSPRTTLSLSSCVPFSLSPTMMLVCDASSVALLRKERGNGGLGSLETKRLPISCRLRPHDRNKRRKTRKGFDAATALPMLSLVLVPHLAPTIPSFRPSTACNWSLSILDTVREQETTGKAAFFRLTQRFLSLSLSFD